MTRSSFDSRQLMLRVQEESKALAELELFDNEPPTSSTSTVNSSADVITGSENVKNTCPLVTRRPSNTPSQVLNH